MHCHVVGEFIRTAPRLIVRADRTISGDNRHVLPGLKVNQANPLPGEVLVSVPLHAKRLRQRGYNQTSLIAIELSRLISIPAVEGCLIRIQNNSPQTGTATVEERRRNVVNAFGCQDERLVGKRVLLIDDVCTSGATLEACAKALKTGGR